jgi:hypothetical protein
MHLFTSMTRKGWRRELSLFFAVYLVYNAARWIFVGDLPAAQAHAHWIVDLEQSAGVAVERSVQGAFDAATSAELLSIVYLAAQFVVLPGVLIWLYRRAPERYRALRNTVVATWLIAVPIFALFPVAPPRLADLGFVDMVSQQPGVGLTGRSTIFYNPVAAVPSLHVGFAFAVSLALAAALPHRFTRALALSWGPLVTLSVVATGNHYVFDVAVGLAVTALGYAVGRFATRERALQHRRGPRATVLSPA